MNSQHMKIWVKGEGVVLSWEGSGEPVPLFPCWCKCIPSDKIWVCKWFRPEMVGTGFKGDFAQEVNGA